MAPTKRWPAPPSSWVDGQRKCARLDDFVPPPIDVDAEATTSSGSSSGPSVAVETAALPAVESGAPCSPTLPDHMVPTGIEGALEAELFGIISGGEVLPDAEPEV
eukprot:1293939-Alexandrium_andersonii.AAC.2